MRAHSLLRAISTTSLAGELIFSSSLSKVGNYESIFARGKKKNFIINEETVIAGLGNFEVSEKIRYVTLLRILTCPLCSWNSLNT